MEMGMEWGSLGPGWGRSGGTLGASGGWVTGETGGPRSALGAGASMAPGWELNLGQGVRSDGLCLVSLGGRGGWLVGR